MVYARVKTVRTASLWPLSTTNRLPRAGGSNQRPCVSQRLLRLRSLQPSLHPGTTLRGRRGRQRLLSVGLSAAAALRRCAGTRRRVDSRRAGDPDGRRRARHDDGTGAVVPITAAERSRHGWVDLAAARDVHSFLS